LTFVEISAGQHHVCARTAAGALHCWGGNFSGELGVGGTASRLTPTPIVAGGQAFQSVSAGYNHTCALTTAGQIYCWGANAFGQLGNGTTNNAQTPVAVTGVAGAFAQVSAGASHTCARTAATGLVFCWGFNSNGQLGDATTTTRLQPTQINISGVATAISVGAFHSCAIRTGGVALCWGFNGIGELGDGTGTERTVPTLVSGGRTFTSIIAGRQATCGITATGTFCWGGGYTGQNAPNNAIAGTTFTAISPSLNHACGLIAGGLARCFGENTFGELGIGVAGFVLVPTPVSGITFAPPAGRVVTRRTPGYQ
jgi:alpha-tubulin suppressor-like RCC1 family protein